MNLDIFVDFIGKRHKRVFEDIEGGLPCLLVNEVRGENPRLVAVTDIVGVTYGVRSERLLYPTYLSVIFVRYTNVLICRLIIRELRGLLHD